MCSSEILWKVKLRVIVVVIEISIQDELRDLVRRYAKHWGDLMGHGVVMEVMK